MCKLLTVLSVSGIGRALVKIRQSRRLRCSDSPNGDGEPGVAVQESDVVEKMENNTLDDKGGEWLSNRFSVVLEGGSIG